MLNPKIKKEMIADGIFGLFATDRIPAGELIWTPIHDPDKPVMLLSWDQIQQLPQGEREVFLQYCYQIGDDCFSGYTDRSEAILDEANFMNHSCDPNCWYDRDDSITARRDIAPGEQITYDYATDTTERDWAFDCCCGSPCCRGRLHRDDWKTLRDAYGDHFISYIKRKFAHSR